MAKRLANVKVQRIVREHLWIKVFADERHIPDIESIEGVIWVHSPIGHSQSLMVFCDGRYSMEEIAAEIDALNDDIAIPDSFKD